jgi:hypothetical protein
MHINGLLIKASWLGALSVLLVSLGAGCSGDDAADDDTSGCDGGPCPDGSIGTSGSGGSGGGAAGRSGSGGSGEAGSSGSSGSSSEPDEDGGTEPTDGGTEPGEQPASDGSQLAACAEDGDCTEDRVCYTPGAQQATGYCTASCESNDDCSALGAEYTCNATGGMGMGMSGGGACRIECEDSDDMSCPDLMTCVETSPDTFRCAYVEDDAPGSQDVELWEPCSENGECVDGLICYGAIAGGPGGGSVGGFCTQPCETDDECTEDEPSGDIAPTCGNTGGCRFDCSEGGDCPEGMECESQGGTDRCLYPQ